jgi:hypothetical protein
VIRNRGGDRFACLGLNYEEGTARQDIVKDMLVPFLPRPLGGNECQDRLAIGFEARLAEITLWDGGLRTRWQPLDGPDHEQGRQLALVNQVCHHADTSPGANLLLA